MSAPLLPNSGGRQQRLVQILLLLVDRARRDHRVVEEVEQIRGGVGVGVAQTRQLLDVATGLRQLRVDIVEDGVGVDDRLSEPIAQPGQSLSGGAQRQVQLDRIHLLRDPGKGLEQRIDLRRHRPGVNHVLRRDPLRRRVLRLGERHILLTEDRGGHDFRVHVGRNQLQVLRIKVQDQLGRRFAVLLHLGDACHPTDLDPVKGDLRAGIHHQARSRRHHRHRRLLREIPPELLVHQPKHQRGDQEDPHTNQPVRAGRRLVYLPYWSRHGLFLPYTVNAKFGLTP